MESNSMISSDSDSSYLTYTNGRRQSGGSTSSLANFSPKNLCPTNLLKFSKLTSVTYEGLRRTHFAGSATATVCVLNKKDMTALNLGDSGFLLIRYDVVSGEPYILLKSKEQTHGFNTPYQLTKLPSEKEILTLKNMNRSKELSNLKKALKDNKFCNDSPEDSDIY